MQQYLRFINVTTDSILPSANRFRVIGLPHSAQYLVGVGLIGTAIIRLICLIRCFVLFVFYEYLRAVAVACGVAGGDAVRADHDAVLRGGEPPGVDDAP